MTDTDVIVSFNYAELDGDTSSFLQSKATEIRFSMRRTAEEMRRIGLLLLEVKERLPHGQFTAWVKAELGMSQSTAWRFMQVAQGKAINKSFTMNDITLQIAAPAKKFSDEDWHALPQETRVAYISLLHLIMDICPVFDALCTALLSRADYVKLVGKVPEQDSSCQEMLEEINAHFKRAIGVQA